MIQNKFEPIFLYGQTKQQIIDRIIDFELEHDILPDWTEVLEYGFIGYQNIEDELIMDLYEEYFGEREPEEDYIPTDEQGYDGHGNPIGDPQ
jgi:hypothetical protein